MIKSRRMGWAGHVARMGEMKNACKILIGKPEVKQQRGIPRRIWEDNIRMDLREMGLEGFDWLHLAHDKDQWRALVNTVMNPRVP
jgi:hypothetical protein